MLREWRESERLHVQDVLLALSDVGLLLSGVTLAFQSSRERRLVLASFLVVVLTGRSVHLTAGDACAWSEPRGGHRRCRCLFVLCGPGGKIFEPPRRAPLLPVRRLLRVDSAGWVGRGGDPRTLNMLESWCTRKAVDFGGRRRRLFPLHRPPSGRCL